jgi:hypothetical protein
LRSSSADWVRQIRNQDFPAAVTPRKIITTSRIDVQADAHVQDDVAEGRGSVRLGIAQDVGEHAVGRITILLVEQPFGNDSVIALEQSSVHQSGNELAELGAMREQG